MQEPAHADPAPALSPSRMILTSVYGLLALGLFAAGYLLSPLIFEDSAPALDRERVKLPRPEPLTAFSLQEVGGDADSAPYTRARLLGQWTLVYFGYTNCPNVCGSALTVLAEVSTRLRTTPSAMSGTELVFVALDPARDSPAALRRFLGRADADIVALRGNEKQIAAIAQQLGILHSLRPADAQGRYLVDHPATILLIDPSAELRAGFAMPRDANRIIELMMEIEADYQTAKQG